MKTRVNQPLALLLQRESQLNVAWSVASTQNIDDQKEVILQHAAPILEGVSQ